MMVVIAVIVVMVMMMGHDWRVYAGICQTDPADRLQIRPCLKIRSCGSATGTRAEPNARIASHTFSLARLSQINTEDIHVLFRQDTLSLSSRQVSTTVEWSWLHASSMLPIRAALLQADVAMHAYA